MGCRDVKTRTKHSDDIAVGSVPFWVAVTPDGKTVFVVNANLVVEPVGPSGNSVSTIDVKTRTEHSTDIPVGASALRVAVTPMSPAPTPAVNSASSRSTGRRPFFASSTQSRAARSPVLDHHPS
jgi:DNA-binding beta-propeller fold protein YncE